MTQRITRSHLHAQVGIVNRLLGHGDDVAYSTPGALYLSGAYGGHGVFRWCNAAGGASDLMGGHQSARECQRFLSGMIAALRIASDPTV